MYKFYLFISLTVLFNVANAQSTTLTKAGLLLQVQMKTIHNTDGSPDQFL